MENKRQFALGVFFVVALSILAFYTLFLTDFTLFRKLETEEVYFPAANGLREGDPVMVSGLRIGRVKVLEYDINAPPRERIKATLALNERVELLEGAQIAIQESTLLGGRQVDIFPGVFGGPPLDREVQPILYGDVEQNPIAALGELGDILSENREMVRSIVTNLDGMLNDTRGNNSVIGRLLFDEEMGADVAATTSNFRAVSDDLRAGRGVLGELLANERLAEDVRTTVETVRTITTDLQAGKGLAGRMLYDEELAERASRAVEELGDFTSRMQRGEGVAGKLFNDEPLAQDFALAIQRFREASEDLSIVADRIRSGEGSMGKLVMDTELYDETLDSVRLVTRSLEDYREAAPISAFTSVLFGAF